MLLKRTVCFWPAFSVLPCCIIMRKKVRLLWLSKKYETDCFCVCVCVCVACVLWSVACVCELWKDRLSAGMWAHAIFNTVTNRDDHQCRLHHRQRPCRSSWTETWENVGYFPCTESRGVVAHLRFYHYQQAAHHWTLQTLSLSTLLAAYPVLLLASALTLLFGF